MPAASAARIAREIVEIGRRLYERGLVSAGEGNVSVRRGVRIFITAAGTSKGFLKAGDIVEVDVQGHARHPGRRQVSTELPMHLAVYAARADVGAVVHAHPPTASGFAAAGIALDRPVLAEGVVFLGPVPLVPYAMPSSRDLAEHVARAIGQAQGVLLANHGALTVGRDLFEAWARMETLEQVARVSLAARMLGGERLLPPDEVVRLRATWLS